MVPINQHSVFLLQNTLKVGILLSKQTYILFYLIIRTLLLVLNVNCFGSDKPDLRFGMELKDVSKVVENCEFSVFRSALETKGSVRGINVTGKAEMPRKP